ncbi:oxidoreductase domain-containing protein [Xylariomycetidae sp. FL2044]|nr:oxidoreductase domain-containing protein [Xylariomycetidae sp. FL2044]
MASFTRKKRTPELMPVKTSYISKEVDIPADYLRSEPHDAKPITYAQIDFEKTPLPHYRGGYAVVLDNVLSPSECARLLELAEASVSDANRHEGGSAWSPALVNAGPGLEVAIPDYRNGDRIIWDSQEIADRLWARIASRPEVPARLASFTSADFPLGGPSGERPGARWEFLRLNRRLRFLKYGRGGFFRPHCDGAYGETLDDGRRALTHFTLHLYLNDSKQGVVGDAAEEEKEEAEVELDGGATTFYSGDESRRFDVHPKAGRVLIFQHKRLYHAGDDVRAGTKYTVRSDIMYVASSR